MTPTAHLITSGQVVDQVIRVTGVLQQDLCKVAPSALTHGPLEGSQVSRQATLSLG